MFAGHRGTASKPDSFANPLARFGILDHFSPIKINTRINSGRTKIIPDSISHRAHHLPYPAIPVLQAPLLDQTDFTDLTHLNQAVTAEIIESIPIHIVKLIDASANQHPHRHRSQQVIGLTSKNCT